MPALPGEVPITTRPDWICEILSTNKRNDLIKKKRAYHLHQVGRAEPFDAIELRVAVLFGEDDDK